MLDRGVKHPSEDPALRRRLTELQVRRGFGAESAFIVDDDEVRWRLWREGWAPAGTKEGGEERGKDKERGSNGLRGEEAEEKGSRARVGQATRGAQRDAQPRGPRQHRRLPCCQ
eukprot:jgi/Mesen1/3568/ME000199S02717